MLNGRRTFENARLLDGVSPYREVYFSARLKENASLFSLSLVYQLDSGINIRPYTCLRRQVFLLAYIANVYILVAQIKSMINNTTARLSASAKDRAGLQAAVPQRVKL